LGKTVKRGKRSLFFINVLLLLIAITFFGYRPLLSAIGNFLVVSQPPLPSDAIVVLAGGDPGRALEAADLYQAHMAPYVVVTTETPPKMFEDAKRHGVELFQTYENYVRTLRGYGVPEQNILRIEPYVGDTLDELTRVRDLAREKQWKRLIIVTSNFHTRRSWLVCRYVLQPEIAATVIASKYDSFNPSAWWTTQGQVRTFSIEAEKLLTYTAYIWPRLIWKDR
jgi:uncharacterized SAM-binding protein YcdF (DUF218 family)